VFLKSEEGKFEEIGETPYQKPQAKTLRRVAGYRLV